MSALDQTPPDLFVLENAAPGEALVAVERALVGNAASRCAAQRDVRSNRRGAVSQFPAARREVAPRMRRESGG
jgi:hypothetical protein